MPSTEIMSSTASSSETRVSPAHAPEARQQLRTRVLTSPAGLLDCRAEWEQLAERASEPNPFYEPWFLLPAITQFGMRERWRILLVERVDEGESALVGFFPFVERRGITGMKHWVLWRHPLLFLATPLVARGVEVEVWNAAWEELESQRSRVLCAEFPLLGARHKLDHSLIQSLRDRGRTTYWADRYPRAILHFPESPEDYLKTVLGGHHLRETRRKRRKLEGIGELTYRRLSNPSYANVWTDWFLALESRGWKGDCGTALAQDEQHARFFKEMVRAGATCGQIGFEGFFLDGEPIALKLNLHRRPATFAYKIAFDENHAKYSPGVLLELESLTHYGQDLEFEWGDSCAIPRHGMIERLWSDRRIIQHLLVSSGSIAAELALGALPLARSLKHCGRRAVQRIQRVFSRSSHHPSEHSS